MARLYDNQQPAAVNHMRFVSSLCQGKRVLSIGPLGPLQAIIDGAARKSYGIDWPDDKTKGPLVFQSCDFERLGERDHLPFYREELDCVVLGGLLKAASDPGRILDVLYKSLWRKLVIVREIACGCEYNIASSLLRSHKYIVADWHWYDEMPPRAAGIIFVCAR